MALCDHANDEGYNARPGVGRLAWKCDMSERQVQRILSQLLKDKAITITKEAGFQTPTHYRVNPYVYPEKAPYKPKGDKLSPLPTPGPIGPMGDKMSPGDISGPKGDKSGAMGDIAMSPESSCMPSFESSESSSLFQPPASARARCIEILEGRGITDPAKTELAAAYGSFEGGPLALITIFDHVDGLKYWADTEKRRGAYVVWARRRWDGFYKWPVNQTREGALQKID